MNSIENAEKKISNLSCYEFRKKISNRMADFCVQLIAGDVIFDLSYDIEIYDTGGDALITSAAVPSIDYRFEQQDFSGLDAATEFYCSLLNSVISGEVYLIQKKILGIKLGGKILKTLDDKQRHELSSRHGLVTTECIKVSPFQK